MSLVRWKAAGAAGRLEFRLARAHSSEARARARAGRALRDVLGPLDDAAPERVRAAWTRIEVLERRQTELDGRLAASLEADRRDYRSTSSAWGRWLVVLRGVLDRLVLREEARRARADLPRHFAELAAASFEDPELVLELSPEGRAELESARETITRLEGERAELLAPWGGELLPRWLDRIVEELGTFGGFVWMELTKKFVLRLPALVAMLVAWWLTHRYTTSQTEGWVNENFGIGRPSVAPETMERLQFWLPLVAAALAAYITSTVSRRIRKRYGEEEPLPPSTSPTPSRTRA